MKKRIRNITLACVAVAAAFAIGIVFWNSTQKLDNPQADADGSNAKFICVENIEGNAADERQALSLLGELGLQWGFSDLGEQLGAPVVTTLQGETYYRFEQVYEGVPVYGRSVTLCASADGNVEGITANVTPVEQADTVPKLDEKQALGRALQELRKQGIEAEVAAAERVIYCEAQEALLCWRVSCGAPGGKAYEVLVDDDGGKIILTRNKFNDATETIQERGTEGMTDIDVSAGGDGNSYVMYDENRNLELVSLEKSSDKPDSDRRITFTKGNCTQEAVDTMKNMAACYDYYNTVLGRHGYDDQNSLMTGVLTSGFYTDGAFSSEGRFLCFGEAGDLFELHAGFALDIVAHEFTHSVINTTADFADTAVGNALNEGYGDVFGNLAEAYSEEETEGWPVGEACGYTKYSMENPKEFHTPDGGEYAVSYDEFSEDDQSGHANAPILSHCMYRMWEGTDGDGVSAGQSAIRDIPVLSRLWYRSLLYLGNDATMEQCRAALELSARQMMRNGEISPAQVWGVEQALEESGIPSLTLSYAVRLNEQGQAELSVYDINGDIYDNYHLEVSLLAQETQLPQPQGEQSLRDRQDKNALQKQKTVLSQDCTQAQPVVLTLEEDSLYLVELTDLSGGSALRCALYTNLSGSEGVRVDTAFGTPRCHDAGNSTGNILNLGLAAADGDWIYYSTREYAAGYPALENPQDGQLSDEAGIYKIKMDGTEKTKLTDATGAYLNVTDGVIYFTPDEFEDDIYRGRVCRMDTDGGNFAALTDEACARVVAAGEWIYYNAREGGSVYRMKTDGSGKEQIVPGFAYITGVRDGKLYYCTQEGDQKGLFESDLDGKNPLLLVEGNPQRVALDGDIIIFSMMGEEDGVVPMYVEPIGGTEAKMVMPQTDGGYLPFNAANGWIYYADSEKGFCRMDIDGSQIQILSSDKVTDINIAGDWIFYNLMDRNLNNLHYKMKTDGSERQHVDGREGAGNEYSSDGQ